MFRHPALVPLSKQHHDGLSLCVLTERELAGDAPDIARLAERIVGIFDIELRNHFELEEDLLFPQFQNELVTRLLDEHRSLERMVDELRTAPAGTTVRAFVELLRDHIRLEENDLFERFQRIVPPVAMKALGIEIQARAVRACLTDQDQ